MIKKDNIFDSSNVETRKNITVLLYENVKEAIENINISYGIPPNVMDKNKIYVKAQISNS